MTFWDFLHQAGFGEWCAILILFWILASFRKISIKIKHIKDKDEGEK